MLVSAATPLRAPGEPGPLEGKRGKRNGGKGGKRGGKWRGRTDQHLHWGRGKWLLLVAGVGRKGGGMATGGRTTGGGGLLGEVQKAMVSSGVARLSTRSQNSSAGGGGGVDF